MIDLSSLHPYDSRLLTMGKLNPVIGIREPHHMPKLHKNKRLTHLYPVPALYFLFSRKELVYIGKCTSLKDRIQDHIRGREFLKGYRSKLDGRWRHDRNIPPKDFDMLSKMYLSIIVAEQIEPIYIAHYRPRLNKVGVDKHHSQMDIFK